MRNFDLPFRPLRIGTSVINGRVNEPGTIGLFGRDEQGSPWLISCYHVLCDGGLRPYLQDETIYQPAAVAAKFAVGKTDRTRSSIELDCAAARITNGVHCESWVTGLGPVSASAVPEVNMRVIKVGAMGGLTEGIVSHIAGASLFIRTDPSFPPEYLISEPGDSGALWLEAGTGKAVALHRGIRSPRTASATDIGAVLQARRLVQQVSP